MSWFKNKENPSIVNVINRLDFGIDIDTWRKSDERVLWAGELFRSELGKDMLAVLMNGMPVPSQDNACFEAGRVRGYQQAIMTIKALAMRQEVAKDIPEPDYSPSNFLPENLVS